jgi:purine-binding chemotaxis protein CheW
MVQLLLFSVAEIHGAIPLDDTSHVIRMVGLMDEPGVHSGEAGAINFHGRRIPVFSARVLFGMSPMPPRLTDMLIIAYTGDGEVALWVDMTAGIQDIACMPELSELLEHQSQVTPGITITPEYVWVISDLTRLIRSVGDAPSVPDVSAIPALTITGAIPDYDPPAEVEKFALSRVAVLLEERARKIAQPEERHSDAAIVEVLKFRLAYQEYAIEMQYIREVILTGEITPVPGTPDYISGICIVRGEIISLVDLRVLLSIPERGLTDLNRVIVLTDHTLTFGILADHITGIGVIELNLMSAPEKVAIPVKNKYVMGMTDTLLIVLDAAAIFADPNMIIEDI